MAMGNVRIAFLHAAEGLLRLDHASLAYQGAGQVLTFTGWHADGTPFAVTTAPFSGHVQIRARQAAREIIAAHLVPELEPTQIAALRREVRMSQKGSGLARLMGGLHKLDSDADVLAQRLEAAMGDLGAEMATTEQVVGNVEKSVSDLRAINAHYSNGAPPLPTSGGLPPSSQS